MSCTLGNQVKCNSEFNLFFFSLCSLFPILGSLVDLKSSYTIKPLISILTIGIKVSFLRCQTETRAAAMNMVNEAIASLRTTPDHHNKDIQEIQTIQDRTLNELNQNINVILQKLNSKDGNQNSPKRNVQSNSIPSSSTLSLAKSMRLDFPRFSGVDPASWVYKAD